MKKFFGEFRAFAMRGNVLDMAVGVIIGGAFSSIVSSMVKDILTPLLSLVVGRIDISALKATIPGMSGGKNIVISYGVFLENVFNFILIAFFVFLIVRTINRVQERFDKLSGRKKEEEKTPAPTQTELLLTEIRDALKAEKAVQTGVKSAEDRK